MLALEHHDVVFAFHGVPDRIVAGRYYHASSTYLTAERNVADFMNSHLSFALLQPMSKARESTEKWRILSSNAYTLPAMIACQGNGSQWHPNSLGCRREHECVLRHRRS